jgi:ribosomal protein S13
VFAVERKDEKTLEKLRAERKSKIDELKERTNYYLTQQLIQVSGHYSCYLEFSSLFGIVFYHGIATMILNDDKVYEPVQKYDLDPAAKAAAASVLASKLGADSGLKIHLGEELNLDAAEVMSKNAEILPSDGLRNRKQPNVRGSRTGSTAAAHTSAQGAESSPTLRAGLENAQPPRFVEHYQGSGASDGGWIAKIAALLVGEDPSQSYALICGNCRMHNGVYDKLYSLIFSATALERRP